MEGRGKKKSLFGKIKRICSKKGGKKKDRAFEETDIEDDHTEHEQDHDELEQDDSNIEQSRDDTEVVEPILFYNSTQHFYYPPPTQHVIQGYFELGSCSYSSSENIDGKNVV